MGIQFGWGLQMANMSSIYENLGAKPEDIPALWLAAPLTGLLVQPVIGYMSDRTWHPVFGRRRPYFLIGAIWALDPILLTDNLMLTPGLILFKNKSSSTNIWPSVIDITLVGM